MLKISDWHGDQFRLGIATDHGGLKIKQRLIASLSALGITVTDCGASVHDPDDDYPDFGAKLAGAVAAGELDCGILICRSGVGMGLVANRFHGVRAATVATPEAAAASRDHNASNVLVVPADYLQPEQVDAIVAAWLKTPFSGDRRHVRRLLKAEDQTYDEIAAVRHVDPEIAKLLDAERRREDEGIELIASENFASAAIRAAQGTVLTNKYAEGYPGKRYYNGCEIVDQVETIAIQRACALFGAEAANVQAHSGSQANMGAYFALIQPGDTVLAMSLDHGGHLTHGHPINFSGMLYKFIGYGVSRETEVIDYDEVERLANEHRPKLIVAGASAYPRIFDFPRLRAIADAVGAKLMTDMAHIAGLVATGLHPSPVPWSEVVTSTTHKTLRGPRSGLILCREPFAKTINSKVFPGLQGGPLLHTIAAKAVCFHEAMQPDFKNYQRQIVANAKRLAEQLAGHGFRIVSGGTDNHLMLVDLRPKKATGKDVATALDKAMITVNKNMIPFDPEKPFVTSGLRLGTPAVTTRGMKEPEMDRIAAWIARGVEVRADDAKLKEISAEVKQFTREFPLPQFTG